MTDGDDLTKQVDQVYKNLLDKFNPAARNLITAGKAYLKALHGAMSASKIYLEALTKVARHSQQGTWGGSSDVGMCLMQMVDVYKEVQAQQMNILKAFYVDLLVPLETNLDKDTKVLQSEQKKFLATHKQKLESYTKASSQLKKHKKKNRANKGAMDKEIKQYQAVEEERMKLEGFVESSLQNAVTQERRRYGFILERQCSLAKHYFAYHNRGASLLQHAHENWQDVAKTREALPERLLAMLPSARPRDECIYSTPLCLEEDAMSISSQVRKARSMDASCMDLSAAGDEVPPRPLTRARSEFNLDYNRFTPDPTVLRRSMAIPEDAGRRAMARALYPYLPSGDNQLSFNEMDLIALIGEKNKGWQYGENLRSQRCGWFPVAYTELLHEEDDSALGFHSLQHARTTSSVGDPACFGPSSLPASIEYPGLHQGRGEPGVVPPLMPGPAPPPHHHHHHHRGHHKHRSVSAGGVQFRATSPTTTATNARSSSSSSSSIPITNESYTRSSPPTKPHVTPSPSLDTLHSSTSTSTTASSTNTVLYNHYHLQHPPRVPAPTLKKSPSLHSHTRSSSSGLTRSYTTVASSSTSTSSSSHSRSNQSLRFHKRVSGNASFHSSDDSGFSNESGIGCHPPPPPPPNPEVDYSDDDHSSGTDQENSRNTLSSRWLWSASSLNCDSLGGSRDDPSFTPCTSITYSNSNSINSNSSNSTPQHMTLPAPGKNSDRNRSTRRRHPSLPSLSSFSVDHFVTVARRKVAKPKSPCAQKIAAQRERSRRTLRRSSSLLCLTMESCVGLDELRNAEYEDLWSGDWKHTSKIDLLVGIPDPPPYDPPPPPTPPPNPCPSMHSTPTHTPRPPMPLPNTQDTLPKPQKSNRSETQKSSSGNSTGTEEEEEEVYMVVKDHRKELSKTITRAHTRKHVRRSLTWASPTPRSSSSPPTPTRRTPGASDTHPKDSRIPHRTSQATRHQPIRAQTVRIQNRPKQIERRVTYVDATPPSLRRKPTRPIQPMPMPTKLSIPTQQSYNGQLNIMNYSDFMNRRLKYPEGASRLDRHSLTTGQLCGPWYDLWGDDLSCDV